ncbi:interleukin-15 [Ictalurus furcatus]|uniref:interleukin-15 n=1 Tax=Ictalurus furcatus TaxID=66913 RepID=UPI00235016B7|nr:interleukin-15 [Ictalurus furcatus]
MALVDIAPMSLLLIVFLVLVSGFGSKPRKQKSKRTLRCICVVWGLGSNLEYHINLEGWNSFLILSCLSLFTTHVNAHSHQSLIELQVVLNEMAPLFDGSKASLYAPLPNVKECTKKLMLCYLLECNVMLHEENGNKDNLEFIEQLTEVYSDSQNCSMCLACETHPLADSRTFSQRMQTFVQKLLSDTSSQSGDCG